MLRYNEFISAVFKIIISCIRGKPTLPLRGKIPPLLSKGQEKCPAHLLSQVELYAFCYTPPLDSHSLLDFY